MRSSPELSLNNELILLGRLIRLLMLDCVVVDSDGSMLLGFGVSTPPPSIEIGIMNSRGDFLIGCLSDPTVEVDCPSDCWVVVSESFDSAVDWRESGFLRKINFLVISSS